MVGVKIVLSSFSAIGIEGRAGVLVDYGLGKLGTHVS